MWMDIRKIHMRNPLKIEVYQDDNKEWRFRFMRSGRILMVSSESYKRKRSAEKTLFNTLAEIEEIQYDLINR